MNHWLKKKKNREIIESLKILVQSHIADKIALWDFKSFLDENNMRIIAEGYCPLQSTPNNY